VLTRILSALVLAPPFVWCVWQGGIWFFVLVMGLSMVAMREYFDLLGTAGHSNQRILGYGWTAALYLALWRWGTEGVLAVIALVPNLFIVKFLSNPAIEGAVFQNAHTFYGMVAFSLPLSYLVLIRNMANGRDWLILLLVLVWVQDSAAYFWGRALGRHKLQVHLSPKKTWEGAILGLATALFAVWGAAVWMGRQMDAVFLAGLSLAGISAQLGDLNESLVKRNVGAKDSGALIPGHGGVLDRFDSFTFAAPVMYYVTLAVQTGS
jgi:phosphatidate cytidylyltransferase